MLSTTLMEMGDRAQAVAVLRAAPFGGAEGQTEAYRLRYLAALAEATGSADVLAEADRLLTAIQVPRAVRGCSGRHLPRGGAGPGWPPAVPTWRRTGWRRSSSPPSGNTGYRYWPRRCWSPASAR